MKRGDRQRTGEDWFRAGTDGDRWLPRWKTSGSSILGERA